MWRRVAISEFICDALMWQRDALSEFISTSTWLCSRAMRFRSIPKFDPCSWHYVWFHYFSQLNVTKLYPISAPIISKIVQITHAIYQGLSNGRFRRGYVGRKVNNASEVKMRRNAALACTPSFSLRVITSLEPSVQSKSNIRSTVNLKKKNRRPR